MNMDKDILDDAIKAWRKATPAENFSDSARSALFQEVRRTDEAMESGFVPSLARAWRWAFLGSVPVVALAAVLMVAGDRHPAMAAHLTAAKVDGQVVFTLANGRSDHKIYRSTSPQGFDRAPAVKMARNRYSENATGGPALVFYRID